MAKTILELSLVFRPTLNIPNASLNKISVVLAVLLSSTGESSSLTNPSSHQELPLVYFFSRNLPSMHVLLPIPKTPNIFFKRSCQDSLPVRLVVLPLSHILLLCGKLSLPILASHRQRFLCFVVYELGQCTFLEQLFVKALVVG